jgi:glycyl-tRNA synthetase beta subunit
MANLLVEIGCEELPAGYIEPALAHWKHLVQHALHDTRLGCDDDLRVAGTPRRLAVFATGVRPRQEDITTEVTGPPAKVAFDADGNPTKAALGFARKQGVDLSKLKPKQTDKGEYAVVEKTIEGRATLDFLADEFSDVARSAYIDL